MEPFLLMLKCAGEQLASLEQRLSADMAALSSLLEVKKNISCRVAKYQNVKNIYIIQDIKKIKSLLIGTIIPS